MKGTKSVLSVMFAAGAALSQAVLYNYVDWTSATVGNAGSASGTLDGITVSYSGDVAAATQLGPGGINYWTPSAPYISGTVTNAPGTTDIVTLDSASTGNTVTFSQAVTNPIMHLVSIGRTSLPVSYTFSVDFDILSYGTGYWGGGGATSFVKSGSVLTGREGHGTIMLKGTFTSFSFDVSPAEYWHGFTIGLPQAVPEPFTMALGAAGALAYVRKRVRAQKVAASKLS